MEVQPGKKRPRSPDGGTQTTFHNNGGAGDGGYYGPAQSAASPHANSVQYTVEWQTGTCQTQTQTAVVTIPATDTCLSIAGSCTLSCRAGSIEILGYTLRGNDDHDDDNNDDNHQMRELHLDSPSWTAWSTILSLEPNTVLVLRSTTTTGSGTTAVGDQHYGETGEPFAVLPSPSSPAPAPASLLLPTFQIHAVQSTDTAAASPAVQVQPTLIPTSWKLSADRILEDLQATASAQSKQGLALFRDTLEEDPLHDHDNDGDDNKNNSMKKNNHGFRIVVAGAKGVGKSTCVRYTVNRLLSSGYEKVVVLDADPGQPELSPSGMLTLTTVTGPLLQQPYHHMVIAGTSSSSTTNSSDENDNDEHDADADANETTASTLTRRHHGSGNREHAHRHEQAYFFGSSTSQTDPVRFLECVAALVQSYENMVLEQGSNSNNNSNRCIPLVVNLDGWVKGLGEQILHALLSQHLRPHHVLQIVGDLKSKTFDLSDAVADTPTVLHVAYAYNSMQDSFVGHENVNASTKSLSNGNGSGRAGGASNRAHQRVPVQSFSISAVNLRAQRLATYFCGTRVWDSVGFGQNGIDDPVCKIANHLAAVKPYIVPWEAVDWQHFALPDSSGDIVSPDMILNALNGSVVGLCHREFDGNDNASENHLLSCAGLGLIRGIDRVRQLFFVITPVAPEQLARVNVLSRGIISLPLEFYFRGVRSECFPYQACDDSKQLDILGADPMFSRNSIARKGGGN
jgi:hypothetical protein